MLNYFELEKLIFSKKRTLTFKKIVIMKKILFVLFGALLISIGAQAQTYSQNQNLVNSENIKLEKRLEEVKNRIYYLEVSLNQRIEEINGSANYSLQKKELNKLEKEKKFAPEDLESLNTEKANLESAISKLKKTGLDGTEYRTESDKKSNLPEQMSQREFNRRSRTQVVKLSDGEAGINGPKKFEGLIINDKMGRGETASFYITRIDIKGVPTESVSLGPGNQKLWSLYAGTYEARIICGAYNTSFIFHVDPRVKNWFEGQEVYWGLKKALSDW